MDASSTDHLPIIAEVNFRAQQAKNNTTIHKRCMKNFTQQKMDWMLSWKRMGRSRKDRRRE